jgi:uncharacterized membrane protein
VIGYPGWLWTYGFDYQPVQRDMQAILRGGDTAEILMRRYGVDFVVLGPRERDRYGADRDYFRQRHDLVLEESGYSVFRVEPGPSDE